MSPKTSAPVVLQRLVGKSWHTVTKVKVAASGRFSVAVKAPSKSAAWALRVTPSWAWGDGTDGQLGNTSATSSPTPVQVAGLNGLFATASEANSRTAYAIQAVAKS